MLIFLLARGGLPGTLRALVAGTYPVKWKLPDYIHGRTDAVTHRKYIFSEKIVTNMTWRYKGRFDFAILHMEEGPVLDAIIEFKFPQNYLPYKARKEDFFQASLYALAIRDMGASTSSTTLVVTYCLQDNAQRCGKPDVKKCVTCSKGRTFKTKFRPERTVRTLEHMEPYWFKKRRPIATPSKDTCIRCPYSDGKCQYAIT